MMQYLPPDLNADCGSESNSFHPSTSLRSAPTLSPLLPSLRVSTFGLEMGSPPRQEKRLFELLDEQQEPFLLHAYLLDHGHMPKSTFRSSVSVVCWSSTACRRLVKRSGGAVRRVFKKLVCNRHAHKPVDSENSSSQGIRRRSFSDCFYRGRKAPALEFERLSCSCLTGGESPRENLWECMESSQLSPVSVLDLHSSKSSTCLSKSDEEISSTSSVDTLEALQFIEDILKYSNSPPLVHTTRVDLSKKLMNDCMIEAGELKGDSRGYLDSERAEKTVPDQIRSWEDLNGHLAGLDFCRSQEWIKLHPEIREIGTRIEAIIFNEIKTEVVLDMMDS